MQQVKPLPECVFQPEPGSEVLPPLDTYDLAVRLETEGVTDSVAAGHYGEADTLAMAIAHFRQPEAVPVQPTRESRPSSLVLYLRGVSFALPVLLCAVTLLTFHFSLWGGDVADDVAAAIAIGTIGSFVITGGFVQAMARRGLFYIGVKEYSRSAIVTARWFGAGVSTLAAACIAGYILNAYFSLLPHPLDWTALAFEFLLGLFWMACGVLYMIEKNFHVAGVTGLGIAVVGILHRLLGLPLLAAQLAGIAIATGAAIAISIRWFRARSAKEKLLPPASDLGRELYLAGPYFIYGCLYYLFLFVDRIVAWTAHTASAALSLQFRGDYESALDISLIAFVVQVGWVHYSLTAFQDEIKAAQATISARSAGVFNRRIQAFYLRRMSVFLPMSLVVSVVVYFGAAAAGLLQTPAMNAVSV